MTAPSIEHMWQGFVGICVHPSMPPASVRALRQAFYAGVSVVLSMHKHGLLAPFADDLQRQMDAAAEEWDGEGHVQ